MDRPDTLRILRLAHDEIITLRRRVSELEPRARAYDHISRVIDMIPEQPQGYGIDAAWEVKRAVDALIAEREAEKEPNP